MNKLLARAAVLLVALLCMRAQAGPTLFLHPALQPAQGQSQVIVDLMIANLKDEDPAAVLGGFDVSLSFDPTYLTPESIEFGNFLGGTDATIEQVELTSPSTLRLFAVSLLEVSADACIFCTGPYLADLQGDSFRLARVAFDWHGPAPAITTIGFASAELAGGFGENLVIAALVPAQVTIPEPGLPALLGLGLVLLGMLSRSRQSRCEGARP